MAAVVLLWASAVLKFRRGGKKNVLRCHTCRPAEMAVVRVNVYLRRRNKHIGCGAHIQWYLSK